MACVYKHYKKGTKNCFYVGIGSSVKRAYQLAGRSRYWKSVVEKYGFDVEVCISNVSYEDAKKWEIYLIGLYGRKDLKTGALVNMTDGGDGGNKSRDAIERQLETAKRNGTYQDMVDRMRLYANKDRSGLNSLVRVECYTYNLNGKFLKKYNTLTELAKELGISVASITRAMSINSTVYGCYVLREKRDDISDLINKKQRNRPITIIYPDGTIKGFKSCREAEKALGAGSGFLWRKLKDKKYSYKDYKIINGYYESENI